MKETVNVGRIGDVAIITLDNPPVNALSFHLRQPLQDALLALRDDETARAVVLACAGRTFVAGADITEFGKPQQRPSLQDLVETLERFHKPTVAAIHGTALGGGLELAMGCSHRVAVSGAKLGLPELKLGLLPGGGGTQRLPRLIGPLPALKAILSSTPMSASDALRAGLVDAVFGDDLLENAVRFARDLAARGETPTAVSRRDEKLASAKADIAGFDAEAADLLKRYRGLDAPAIAVRSVRNSLTMPVEEALEEERRYFRELLAGDQSRAQRHLFFAEREAAKVPGIGREHAPRKIGRAGVIGAGAMGGGIAMSFANGGIPVTVLEMSPEALSRGMGLIEKNYASSMARGSLSESAKAQRVEMLKGTLDYVDLADCDLIVEAVFEDMQVKQDVFTKLDKVAKPGAVLASNTSYLDIDRIAAFTSRPQDVVGLHFFSPANVMKLLEIVRGRETDPAVVATALSVAKQIGKVSVVVGVCHGFVGNRMLAARATEIEDLLVEGASPEQVDKVFTDFGWPMGPYQMRDLAGLDIGWRNRKSLGLVEPIADTLCERGCFGQKAGKGYYLYDGGRTPKPYAEVAALIEEEARRRAVTRRAISTEEIIERMLYPMVNEGARILEDGIATRSSDIDIVWVNGYGFPVGKGGPMFWAERVGLAKIVERLEHWHGRTGKAVYEPSHLLRTLAASGGGFAQASRATG